MKNLYKTIKPLLFIFILLNGSNLFGQDLEITYDVVTDKVSYFRKGKQVNTPKVRQNRNLLVKIVNFNNFLMEAKIEAEAKEEVAPINSSSGFNLTGLVSNLGESSNNAFQKNVNEINATTSNAMGYTPIPNAAVVSEGVEMSPEESWEDSEDDFGFGGTEPSTTDAEKMANKEAEIAKQLNTTYQQIVAELAVVEKQVRTSTDKVVSHLNTLLLTNVTAAQLQKLKLNPAITNEVRQQVVNELFTELLQQESSEIKLKDALTFANTFEKSTKIDMNQLRDDRGDLANKLRKLELLQSAIIDLKVAENASIKTLKRNVDSNLKSAKVLLNTSNVDDSNSKDVLELISSFNYPEKITALYLQYQEIKLNVYEHTFTSTSKGDFMEITISIFSKEELEGNKAPKLVKKRTLVVPVIGGVKVNSSVGLGFTNYFSKQETYYNSNSLIVANDGDNFVPVITTLLHFYPQTASSVAVGGNFGVGFPVLGDNKSLNFFLGTSVLMGKTQRFVLNFGFMGGQVQRLDRGLNVGDSFGSTGEIIPTRNKYELGYFLSGTFNL